MALEKTHTTTHKEPSAGKRYVGILGYIVLLFICLFAIVVGVTRFTEALPTIGDAVASPFTALFGAAPTTTPDGVNIYDPSASTTPPVIPGYVQPGSVGTYQPPITATTTPPNTGTPPAAQPGATPVSYSVAYYTQGRDLSVRIMSYSSASVRFLIMNIGNVSVNAGWQFNANLPIASAQSSYTSPLQPALAPGQGYIYTLSWNASANQQYYPSQSGYCTQPVQPSPYYGTPYPMQESNCTTIPYGSPNYVPSYYYPQQVGTVSVVADPAGTSGDVHRNNNSASASAYF